MYTCVYYTYVHHDLVMLTMFRILMPQQLTVIVVAQERRAVPKLDNHRPTMGCPWSTTYWTPRFAGPAEDAALDSEGGMQRLELKSPPSCIALMRLWMLMRISFAMPKQSCSSDSVSLMPGFRRARNLRNSANSLPAQ